MSVWSLGKAVMNLCYTVADSNAFCAMNEMYILFVNIYAIEEELVKEAMARRALAREYHVSREVYVQALGRISKKQLLFRPRRMCTL